MQCSCVRYFFLSFHPKLLGSLKRILLHVERMSHLLYKAHTMKCSTLMEKRFLGENPDLYKRKPETCRYRATDMRLFFFSGYGTSVKDWVLCAGLF